MRRSFADLSPHSLRLRYHQAPELPRLFARSFVLITRGRVIEPARPSGNKSRYRSRLKLNFNPPVLRRSLFFCILLPVIPHLPANLRYRSKISRSRRRGRDNEITFVASSTGCFSSSRFSRLAALRVSASLINCCAPCSSRSEELTRRHPGAFLFSAYVLSIPASDGEPIKTR